MTALWLGTWPLLTASAIPGRVSLTTSGGVKAGEEVVLTVMLTGATDIRGVAITPTYDKTQFTLTEGEWLTTGPICDFSVEKGDGVIAFDIPTEVNEDILTFALRVNDKMAAGEYTVGCTVVVSGESGNQTLTAQTAVTVEGAPASGEYYDEQTSETVTDKIVATTGTVALVNGDVAEKAGGVVGIGVAAGAGGILLIGSAIVLFIKKRKKPH